MEATGEIVRRAGRRERSRTIALAWRELIAAELARDRLAADDARRADADSRVRQAEHGYQVALRD